MTPERTRAYQRVMRTLDELGPSKLQPEEQDRIREAADTLIFSTDLIEDAAAREALDDSDDLCRSLVESDRWEQVTASRLASDIRECGPVSAVQGKAAA